MSPAPVGKSSAKTWVSPRTQWLVRGAILAIPHLVLMGFGCLWIWQNHYTIPFLTGAAAITLVAWVWSWWTNRSQKQAGVKTGIQAAENWSPRDQATWAKVQQLADQTDFDAIPLENPTALWQLLLQVIGVVAKEFHPRSKDPLLEVPVPSVLRVIELVTQDLRQALSQQIPGSHLLTINDLRRMHGVAQWVPTLMRIYRVASFAVNPAAGVAREIGNYATGQVTTESLAELKRWVLRFVVERAGQYAIELYAGRLVIDEAMLPQELLASTQAAQSLETRRDSALHQEPLRVLICGQVKAGKSSLVNALFGEVRAAVDVVPTTRGVQPYHLTRDGIERALILDTGGYEDATQVRSALAAVKDELPRCDLILLVVSALSAARDADFRLLSDLRAELAAHPERAPVAILIVLTHIDGLRPFREWNPPYNVEEPTNPKARMIREAIEAVAQDLQVEADAVIPVCLEQGRIYNVDEALIPAVLERIPDAGRARYLRALKEFKDEQAWRMLGQQAKAGGRLLKHLGLQAIDQFRRTADRWL